MTLFSYRQTDYYNADPMIDTDENNIFQNFQYFSDFSPKFDDLTHDRRRISFFSNNVSIVIGRCGGARNAPSDILHFPSSSENI